MELLQPVFHILTILLPMLCLVTALIGARFHFRKMKAHTGAVRQKHKQLAILWTCVVVVAFVMVLCVMA